MACLGGLEDDTQLRGLAYGKNGNEAFRQFPRRGGQPPSSENENCAREPVIGWWLSFARCRNGTATPRFRTPSMTSTSGPSKGEPRLES